MDEDEQQERQLNIHLDPEQLAGVYANFANVSFSDYEFTLTFARIDHEVDERRDPGRRRRPREHVAAVHGELIDALAGLLVEVVDPRGDPGPAGDGRPETP